MEKFYITTTIPYVNAPPHIGFALEMVQADAIARYQQLLGKEVVFSTGTDEHGLKIYRQALAEKKDPQAYVDEYAAKFEKLKTALNLSYTNFIRTTDVHHKAAAQEFWKRCEANGDIYKTVYKIKYCVGCELEKTDSELTDGRCPIHANLELEILEEENYFFKLSRYQAPLLEFYDAHPDFVVPDFRYKEVRQLVEGGLHDFSISRLKEKMPWGVPVPGDEQHVMYVWFDALVNYISTLGWSSFAEASEGRSQNEKRFKEFWPGVQIAGKDQLRQQCVMWQAMLMSAGLPNTRQVIVHGFITSGGQKMSKSVGNVVDPFALVEKYGTDAVRFWFLHDLSPFEDGDFTAERFHESYTAHLANGLGNFAARVETLAEKLGAIELAGKDVDPGIGQELKSAKNSFTEHIGHYRFNDAMTALWDMLRAGDEYINRVKPWETNDPSAIYTLVVILDNVAALLEPFLPKTAEAITKSIVHENGKVTVKKSPILFPRIS